MVNLNPEDGCSKTVNQRKILCGVLLTLNQLNMVLKVGFILEEKFSVSNAVTKITYVIL